MTSPPALQDPSWRRLLRVDAGMVRRIGTDPAILLRVYAGVALICGAYLFLIYAVLDPRLGASAEAIFGTQGQATGIAGVLLMALGLCARAFASADAATRSRGLHALAGAQMLLVAALWFASRDLVLAPAATWPLLAIAALFAYLGPSPPTPERSIFGSPLTLFGRSAMGLPPRPAMMQRSRGYVLHDVAGLRSEYERRIQEAARQEERHRLARDLHDAIKQQIFVVQTAAATAQARFDTDPAGVRQALEDIRRSARAAMTEMEVMLDQLQAAALEPTGLVEALRTQCEALGFRTGAAVDFTVDALPPGDVLRPGATHALLRVAQEALANVGRHARAAHVRVALEWTGDRVTLMVRDDGSGFSPGAHRLGMGMANMSARAAEFGGSLEVVSAPGAGTTITVALPAESSMARADAHLHWALLHGGIIIVLIALIAPSVWGGEPIRASSSYVLFLLLLFAAHLGAYHRLRRRAGSGS